MSCLENFLNKPVLLQLGDPIVAAHSQEEVTLDEKDEEGNDVLCGRAVMTMQEAPVTDQQGRQMTDPRTNAPAVRMQPVLVQILKGEIVAISKDGVMFSTVGGDNSTQVVIYVPNENVRAVTFALEHKEPEKAETSTIIKPN